MISIGNFFSSPFFVIMSGQSIDDLLATLSSPAVNFEAAISPIAAPSTTESWSHVSSGTSSVTGGLKLFKVFATNATRLC